jgi:superoxide dismutase
MPSFTRRNFLFVSSGAAAGTFLAPGLVSAADGQGLDFSKSGLVTGQLKALRHKEVPGFLSAEQIAPHHTAHYGGALKAFTTIDAKFEDSFTKGTAIDPAAFETMQRLKSSRGNSVVLHEMYFDGLALRANEPVEDVRKAIKKRFGS